MYTDRRRFVNFRIHPQLLTKCLTKVDLSTVFMSTFGYLESSRFFMKKLKESKEDRRRRLEAKGTTRTRVVESKKNYNRKKSSDTKPEDFLLRNSTVFRR